MNVPQNFLCKSDKSCMGLHLSLSCGEASIPKSDLSSTSDKAGCSGDVLARVVSRTNACFFEGKSIVVTSVLTLFGQKAKRKSLSRKAEDGPVWRIE